jgi:type I restriction enzyme R subunit
MEKDPLTKSESKLCEALKSLKTELDNIILQNSNMMNNENYITRMMEKIVIEQLMKKHHLQLNATQTKNINSIMVKEYINEFHGSVA